MIITESNRIRIESKSFKFDSFEFESFKFNSWFDRIEFESDSIRFDSIRAEHYSRQSTFCVKLAEGGVDPAIIEEFAKDKDLIQDSNKI